MNTLNIVGKHDENTIKQIETAMLDKRAVAGLLSADGHLGYSFPIGGTVAYKNAVSPSGVGFDIACGNKAALLDLYVDSDFDIEGAMDAIYNELSFGIGQKNNEIVEHELFNDPLWDILPVLKENEMVARNQLGTIGSGNHFVDLLVDGYNRLWIGVHFGSRGLGHKIATHYIKEAGGTDGMFVSPVVLSLDSELGEEYIAAMEMAGIYAYAGRDWVVQKVADIIGAEIVYEVHNHHNYAWFEEHEGIGDVVVVRKGATPIFPGQSSFIGGSMGDISVIVEGIESERNRELLRTTVHGAGRVMSRRQAAGKTRFKKGQRIRVSEGEISEDQMYNWLDNVGVTLRGGGVDESPFVYRRLPEVLDAHKGTFEITYVLTPIGVAMAGNETIDPYKD